jgi:tetratricopeptide (TPR) repeat protein
MFSLLRRHHAMARAIAQALAIGTWTLSTPTWAQAQTPTVTPTVTPATPTQPGAAAAPSAPAAPPLHSAMDAPLFYQLLIGEMELRGGEAAAAYEVILNAARRTRDAQLFRRAVDIAIQGRALPQALAAVRAWRGALPDSIDALRLEVQILGAGGRAPEMADPLRNLLRLTPAAERPGLILALPRFLERSGEPRAVASVLSEVLKPYAEQAETRIAARVAVARAWLTADDPDIALALARDAHQLDPDAPAPALLALELMRSRPVAEEIVTAHLARSKTPTALRLAYIRTLTGSQRYAEAVRELNLATREQPDEPGPFLTLGVLQIELKHPQEGEAALLRYVELVQSQAPAARASASAAAAAADDGEDDAQGEAGSDQGLVQAWLSLAQVAEERGDFKAAEAWLAKVDDPRRALDVQTRRATILARQGQISQARETLRHLPERNPEDARRKLLAEAGVLREVKRWKDAFDVLATANQRFPDDPDLLYEQAMMAEKTERLDDMEGLLRRVMAIKPDNPHAHNALGYSLAERGLRLTEARDLIVRALELAPGDPFITDSLGWVEFKLGRPQEALRLLRQAYSARPDTEIGAHLGEVLWSVGEKDQARQIWREAQARDSNNDVLRETLARLRVDP